MELVRLQTVQEVSEAEPLFREYVGWGRDRLLADYGTVSSPAEVKKIHDGFRAEWPKLVSERGRIYLALMDDCAAGVGALKPLSAETAEVKRLFVRPGYRGLGIARTLLARLLDDARDLCFVTVCLETMPFMTEAHHLYRSVGFVGTGPYAGESAHIGLDVHSISMELSLGPSS
jgi:GNAT superfamily N-acetyltransferase